MPSDYIQYIIIISFQLFVAVNCCVACLLVIGLYFRLLTPAPPLCNKGKYSLISYISDALLGQHRDRWIIYVCDYGHSCGELPLRLDGIISTYILSVLSARKFGILFTKPMDLQQLLKPVKTDWIVDPSALGFATCNYYNFMFYHELVDTLKTTDLDWEFPEEVVYIRLNGYYWNSLYQNPRYGGKLRDLGYTASGTYYQSFLNLFEPQPQFKKTVLKYSNQFKSNLSTNLVCVLLSETDQNDKRYPMWKFLEEVSLSKNTRIVLSANQDLMNETLKRFSRDVFTVSGPQRYIDGEETRTSSGEKLTDNLVANLLDFYTLMQCDELVLTCGSVWGRLVAFCRNTDQGLRYLQNGALRNVDLDALSMDFEEGACSKRSSDHR